MTYTVSDIAELFRHHLVLSIDDETADALLRQLVSEIAGMATTPLWRRAEWVFCDRCGTSIDTIPIHPDGHHHWDDGDFHRVDCWGKLG